MMKEETTCRSGGEGVRQEIRGETWTKMEEGIDIKISVLSSHSESQIKSPS